jgi:hypothetical protein
VLRVAVRVSVAGPVDADEPYAFAPCGIVEHAGFKPGARRAVEVQRRRAVRVAILGIREAAAIAKPDEARFRTGWPARARSPARAS